MPGGHAVSKLLWNGADGSTAVAIVVVPAVAVAEEFQVESVVTDIAVKWRRPVVAAATSVVADSCTDAIARSGEEDAVSVGAGDLVTVYALLGCPTPSAVIT